MTSTDALLEAAAEAIVFAHEADMPALPTALIANSLERTAALAAAALNDGHDAPRSTRLRLAAAGLSFCASHGVATALTKPHEVPTIRRARAIATPFLLGLAAGITVLWALQTTPSPPTAADQLARLLHDDATTVRVGWQGGPSALRGDVLGEVVWNQARQEGYLTFRGLPPLGPDQRFQLWIVDDTREGAPVDGGLFAIADPRAETVVPVQARLPIGKPAAFVVTVEPRAGVVVSKQEHIVAIAGL
ncbi:MAG: anti-sigma factor [Planctomycetota bacterium]